MKPNGLKQVIVTLFERNGQPFIRLLFIADNGEECNVETELDCRQFRINFDEEPQPKQLRSRPNSKLN